jgi:hypothetical protein
MTHSYTALNNPVAQIAAAEAFCENLLAHLQDEYKELHRKKPPNANGVHAHNVLDSLARLGLRFELDGLSFDDGDAYFMRSESNDALCRCLHGYATLVAEEFEENEILVGGKKCGTETLIKLHGCAAENLVFVPDYDGVASAAYFLVLRPGETPNSTP